MYQLYKGDKPLATFVPKDASELPYSNGVSVKDMLDIESLTITRTENNLVSSLNACSAYKRSGIYQFILNVGVIGNKPSDFVEIGRIANWNANSNLYAQIVGQHTSYTMATLLITTTGIIRIFIPTDIGSVISFRGNFSTI